MDITQIRYFLKTAELLNYTRAAEQLFITRQSLRQAIAHLPEREGMVIRLRYFHGLTQYRVAKVLGVSQVQVSRIEKKALGQLKELLL